MTFNNQKTILLVEDDELLSICEMHIIQGFGYRVITADTGAKAVELATAAETVDLVLMDINLGAGMDGTEAARRILKARHLPIVFLTSHAEKEYVDRVKEITRYGYVIKNSGDLVLQSSIEMAFELFEAHRNIERNMELLRDSEEKYRTAIEHSNDMIWMMDREGRFTFLNSRAQESSGYPESALLGTSFVPLVPADDLPRIWALIKAALEGTTQNFDVDYFKKDGSKATLSVNMAPVFTRGEVSGVVCFGRDITDREQVKIKLQESEARYRRITEGLTDYQYTVRVKGGVVAETVHGAACVHVTGYSAEEFAANPYLWIQMVVPEDRELVIDRVRRILEGVDIQPIEHRIIRKNGDIRWVRDTIILFKDDSGKILSYDGVIQDITFRKQAEEELRKAKELAEKATNLKDQFVSLVAHDIKSPFITIIGFLNLIFKDQSRPVHPEHKKLLEAVLDSSRRLGDMVDQLLEIGRLQTGKIELKPFFMDGRKAADMALNSLSHQAHEKGIELINHVPEGTRLYADSQLFGQVLLNLVSNAIKFCGEGGRITFFVPDARRGALALKDTGTGISEYLLPNLFTPEVKTSTPGTKGEKGTGLGLPLSHDIMKAHGGTLAVESKPGEGSVFFVQLPHVRPLVLLVDADPNARRLLVASLQPLDLDLREAESGKAALAVLEQGLPHLIITDMKTSEMDGFDFIEHLKNGAATRNIPIIVFASDVDTKTREKIFSAGANDLVAKPVTREDLAPRIRRFIA